MSERAWPGRIVVLLAVLGAVAAGAWRLGPRLPDLLQGIAGLGPWAGAAFVALYAVAVVLLVPGSVLTLAAGAIFGVVAGTAYAWLGAALGSLAAFAIARAAGRAPVERVLGRSASLGALDRAVAEEGLKVVLLLRLSPVIPFSALNYALGLTRVRARDVALGAFGMLPGTLLYVAYGAAARDLAAAWGGGGGAGGDAAAAAVPQRGPWEWALLALGLAATVAVTVLLARKARALLLTRDAPVSGDPAARDVP